jgi:hypothetical protein
VAATTNPPPAQTGGNAKYAIIGAVLLGAAILIWFLMQNCGQEPIAEGPAAMPDAGPINTGPTEPELYIPPPEPDAGPVPDAGPRHTKIIYRTRYIAGDWECSGDIPAARIQAVVAENRRQVRNCYERALKRNNQLQGSLTLSMKIGRDGNVEATRVGGNLGDQEVFACVRTIASQWRFPVPAGGACAVVRAPFSFTPQQP